MRHLLADTRELIEDLTWPRSRSSATTGSWVPYERPEMVNTLIREFVD
jgi:hypothetical protein